MKRNCGVGSRRFSIALSAALLIEAAVLAAAAQPASRATPGDAKTQADIRGSAAYAEVLLKKTELQAELEGLLTEYTDDFPKVVENRQYLELIEKERVRLLALKPGDAGKLSTALGRLMVKKAEAELELWSRRRSMTDSHPDVKRAKRMVEIYEAAVKEILG